MEVEGLLTSTKWEILKRIAKKPQNPLHLAETLGTSIANISQQLRLLEAAGLVTKERVPNRERGKPRTLYSLKSDLLYVAVLSKDLQHKEMLTLTDAQKQVVKKWLK